MGRLAYFGVLTVALALGCVKNPATGERQLILVPKQQELEIGKQAAQEVGQTIGFVQNAALQKYVARVGQRLAARSERPQLPWSFQVVDDASINAFALPGGYIFVTRGLLAHLNNEAQLASVIGHEIGHVTGKHALNRISKAQLAQVGLGVGMLLSEDVRRFGQLGSVGLSVLFLKFSRDDEHESDELGIRYALRAGYDVREMPPVLAMLDRVSKAARTQDRLPEWLSTHPNPENRIENTRERIAQLNIDFQRVSVDPEQYLRPLDGLAFGPNPRHGYFKGDRFHHPDLKFTLDLPAGWQKTNLNQAVVAVSPDKDAGTQLTLTMAASPQHAERAFLDQPAVKPIGTADGPIQGLPSRTVAFTADTESGPVAGLATFVAHGGRTYQILSFSAAARAPMYEPTFRQVSGSFGVLTDPAALAVQPARLSVVALPRRMTFAQLYQERPSTASIETLILMNQAQPSTVLEPGQIVKWVHGGTQAAPGGARPSQRELSQRAIVFESAAR